MRRRRRQLGVGAQIISARRLVDMIVRQTIYSACQHIALYLASDGEISLRPLLEQSWFHGKHCYLPVIHGKQLQFMHFTPGAPLVSNQFGILEPTAGRYCHLINIEKCSRVCIAHRLRDHSLRNRVNSALVFLGALFTFSLGSRSRLCGLHAQPIECASKQ